ncbi:MAG: phytanoyl-CoA dioxygenase family protein [Chitinophagaceae bacterium]
MQTDLTTYKNKLEENGFAIIDKVFTDAEVKSIIKFIEENQPNIESQSSKEVFAIRKLFNSLPGIKEKIFNTNVKCIIKQIFGKDYFITKGLYFDKPALSNWFVAYHQDISIAVSNRSDSPLFKRWTVKGNVFGVEPPVNILESVFTIRIHLDDCTSANGALHVIPGSHKNGIQKPKDAISNKQEEVICELAKGGVMLMRPLLLHASHKSTSTQSRRVLHIEFSNVELPTPLRWAEKELF